MAKVEQAAEQPKKKSKLKLILLFVLIFIVLLGAAGAFWFFTIRDPGVVPSASQTGEVENSEQGAATAATAASSASSPAGSGTVTDTPHVSVNVAQLPTLNVNLLDPGANRYLRLGLEVEVGNPDALQEIRQNEARIRDALIILLSSKSATDLATAEGKMQLKNEIASRINQILGTPRVIRIYFTDFVIT